MKGEICLAGFHRVLNAGVEQSAIATQAVSYDKERIDIQTAVATLPPSAAYKTFTRAYGTPPAVILTMAGTTSRNQAGTLRLSFDVIRIRPGSFQWRGTPAVSMRWTSVGDRA